MLNADGECSTVADGIGRSKAQADWLGSKVSGHQRHVLLSQMQRVKSHNGSPMIQ